jgi:hypothetical protein
VRAIVSGSLLGAVTRLSAEGAGSIPESLRIMPPQWAHRVQFGVSVPRSSWNRITGFGVTVFDTAGTPVSDGPLIYSGARQILELDSLDYRGGLDVELLPAFARGDLQPRWTAELEVVYLLPEAVDLTLPDGSERAGVVLGPAASRVVDFELSPSWQGTHPDLSPLVEVVAQLPVGPPAIRRGVVVPREHER